MGSSRLPGKILISICGRPLLEHIITNLKGSSLINEICVATTDNRKDDELAAYLENKGIGYFRGSENDIVSRLYHTALKFNADTLVRVWGDCPLITAPIVDRLLEEYLAVRADFASNDNPATYPLGMNAEVYRFKTLEDIFNGTQDPFYREFPFEYIKDHPEFKAVYVSYNKDVSHFNLTVDYPQDLEVISEIITQLSSNGGKVELKNIIDFCEKNAYLFKKTEDLSRNIEYKNSLRLREKNKDSLKRR